MEKQKQNLDIKQQSNLINDILQAVSRYLIQNKAIYKLQERIDINGVEIIFESDKSWAYINIGSDIQIQLPLFLEGCFEITQGLDKFIMNTDILTQDSKLQKLIGEIYTYLSPLQEDKEICMLIEEAPKLHAVIRNTSQYTAQILN